MTLRAGLYLFLQAFFWCLFLVIVKFLLIISNSILVITPCITGIVFCFKKSSDLRSMVCTYLYMYCTYTYSTMNMIVPQSGLMLLNQSPGVTPHTAMTFLVVGSRTCLISALLLYCMYSVGNVSDNLNKLGTSLRWSMLTHHVMQRTHNGVRIPRYSRMFVCT